MSWLINNQTPEALGLTLAAGEFRAGSAGTLRLTSGHPADAGDVFAHNAAVTVTYNDVVFFRGKARRADKSASGEEEGHDYVIEDAWSDLETTTYQENWAYGDSGVILLPQVWLGVDHTGTRITVGQQIAAAVAFAATAGVAIQAGSMPAGLDLWPTEVTGMSCAEVIRTCLRYHPDWVPWIDHTTTPHPTLQVTPRDSATVRTLAFTETDEVGATKRDDRLPDCVRIVFTTATEIDGAVYRDCTIQKYPVDGADAGPGVLTTMIEMGGASATIAKQQIETRPLPVPGFSTRDEAKDWVKLHYPIIGAIANTHFGITAWAAAVVADANPKPDPINPHSARLALRDMDDAPYELVDGSVHEWMRQRVGKVEVKMTITPGPLATAAEIELLKKIPPVTYVTGTTATTKIYKGRPQWLTVAEQAPAGLAEAYYNIIQAGCMYEGRASFVTSGMGAGGWAGGVLNISGGAGGWATMKAPIHSVSFDLQTDQVTLGFGPNPDFSVQDYAEYLRLLRNRPAMWMSREERTSPTLGDEAGPSAKYGDAIGPSAGPKETAVLGGDTKPPFWAEIVMEEAATEGDPGTPKWIVTRGRVFERQRATAVANMAYHEPTGMHTGGVPTRYTCVSGQAIHVKVVESLPGGTISSVTIHTGAANLQSVEVAGVSVTYYYRLAEALDTSGTWSVIPFLTGSHIYHWPEGKGLNLQIKQWEVDSGGRVSDLGVYQTHYWRKGAYVGTTNPGTTADHTQEISQLVFPPLP